MTLTRMYLKNFQRWDSLEVQLSPTVTVLVGDTDTGKSSVLRALRWLCMNVPDGDSFIRYGSKSASVRLDFDSHSVTRYRGSKGNSYELDGKSFVSFGRGKVPDTIASLLNVSPLSFQSQHSAPYLLSLSPGEVSRELNRVVDLESIDRALVKIAAEVRKTQACEELCRQRLSAAESRLSELSWVEDARAEWDALEVLRMDAEKTRSRAALGAKILSDVASATVRAEQLSEVILSGKKAIESGRKAFEQQERADRLEDLVDRISELQEKTERRQGDPKAFEELAELHREVEGQKTLVRVLKIMAEELESLERQYAKHSELVIELKGGIDAALLKYGCPVCGSVCGPGCG